MPVDGRARGLPKGAREYGTCAYVAAASSWQDSACNVPAGLRAGDFVAWFTGQSASVWLAPAWSSNAAVNRAHVGDEYNAGQTVWSGVTVVELLAAAAAWPASMDNGNTTVTYSANIMAGFRPEAGFRPRHVRSSRTQPSGTTAPLAVAANPMGRPGGLVVATATIDIGGAGPDAAVTGAGWKFIAASGLAAAAYYILPLDAIVTPPTPTFSCGRSDGWAGVVSYIAIERIH